MTEEPIAANQADYPASHQKALILRRFLESVTGILGILALVALPISLSRIWHTGFLLNHMAHILLSLAVAVTYFRRKACSDRCLLWSILLIFSATSLAGFLQFGVISAGFFFAAATIFTAALARGLRGGLWAGGFFGLAISVIAYWWMTGRLALPLDANLYVRLPAVWLTLGVAFLITTGVFIVSAAGFVRGMNELVDTIDQQKEQITAHSAELARANQELTTALHDVRTLSDLLPICAGCKKIRDDQGYWQQVEEYMRDHAQMQFTHSLCPDCVRKLYPELAHKFSDPSPKG
ncbi:MAG: hypothetical protein KQJ78_02880 [Deltaproteobacteria bacterium]|nr:hypothetical protein [Deltaproteobacteria bacterium]